MRRPLLFAALVVASPALAHPAMSVHVHPGVDWTTVAFGIGTIALAMTLSALVRR